MENQNATIKIFNITNSSNTTAFIPLSLRRQVLHDQLLLNLPRAGRQQGYVVVAVRCEEPAFFSFFTAVDTFSGNAAIQTD